MNASFKKLATFRFADYRRKLAEITDVGFNNVDEVIAKLVEQLPDDIPNRSMVIFKIENQDKKQSVVYERMKGKGF